MNGQARFPVQTNARHAPREQLAINAADSLPQVSVGARTVRSMLQ